VERWFGVGRTVVTAVALSFAACSPIGCVPIDTEWTQKDGETFPPFEFRPTPAPDAYADYDDYDGYYYADYTDEYYYGDDYYDGSDTSDSDYYYYYDGYYDTTDGYYYWSYNYYYYWSPYWYYSDYYGHYGGSDGPIRPPPDSGGSAF
jgi:hypothetical protein